jgi:hypothetical protein
MKSSNFHAPGIKLKLISNLQGFAATQIEPVSISRHLRKAGLPVVLR